MTTHPITIPLQATLRDAVELLAKHGISGAPVIDGERVVGTLSTGNLVAFAATTPGVPGGMREEENIWDQLNVGIPDDDPAGFAFYVDLWNDDGAETSTRFATSESVEWDVLAEHTVEEAMSREIVALPPTTSLREAAEQMCRTGAHRVLVTEDDVLLGVVTTMDVTRSFAARGRSRRGPAVRP